MAKSILEHFAELPDPRMERTRLHKLGDILAIAICAVICGIEGWTDIELFGKPKGSWFKTFLELPNGIPSHDTFGVKGNQGTLHEEVKLFLDDAIGQDFKKTQHDFHKTVDGGHGRIETRSIMVYCSN